MKMPTGNAIDESCRAKRLEQIRDRKQKMEMDTLPGGPVLTGYWRISEGPEFERKFRDVLGLQQRPPSPCVLRD